MSLYSVQPWLRFHEVHGICLKVYHVSGPFPIQKCREMVNPYGSAAGMYPQNSAINDIPVRTTGCLCAVTSILRDTSLTATITALLISIIQLMHSSYCGTGRARFEQVVIRTAGVPNMSRSQKRYKVLILKGKMAPDEQMRFGGEAGHGTHQQQYHYSAPQAGTAGAFSTLSREKAVLCAEGRTSVSEAHGTGGPAAARLLQEAKMWGSIPADLLAEAGWTK